MLLQVENEGILIDEHDHEAISHDSIYIDRNGYSFCLYGAGAWSGTI